jgi:hypothetical protein
MITIVFACPQLLVLEAVSKGMKLNSDYFIQAVLSGLPNEKQQISREKGLSAFSVDMDNSMDHSCHNISGKMTKEVSNELHTQRILQISVRATFGFSAC